MAQKIVNVSLRLPAEMHAALAEWAEQEHRSLHGQIVQVLATRLEQRSAERGNDARRSVESQ